VQPNWFIALPVDASGWLEPLQATAPRTLRRFHPEDVHLTLAFLGHCGEDPARAAWALAQSLPLPDFTVTLAGLACMGNPRKPSAFSAELDKGHDEVAAYLGAHRDALLQAAGTPLDDRPPLPHITVGRPPRSCTSQERAELVAWARRVPPLGVLTRLDRLALYTWSDDRATRQFQVVAQRGGP
jgi:2'-5' RNA ligase